MDHVADRLPCAGGFGAAVGALADGVGADDPTRLRRRIGFIFEAHILHESLAALYNVIIGV